MPTVLMCLWLILHKVKKTNIYILMGIFFSMLCDIFMAFPDNRFITFGIAANLIGLYFYIRFFLQITKRLGLIESLLGLIIFGVSYIILFKYLGNLIIPVLIYSFAYVLLLWRATVVFFEKEINKSLKNLCFFGSLFLAVSDILLSIIIFNVFPYQEKYYYIVMVFWWAGLYLIMLSAKYIESQSRITQDTVSILS